MKTELAPRFSNVEAKIDPEKVHLFGRFSENPQQFSFNLGERRLIEIFTKHVSDEAKKPEGLNRFKLSDANMKKRKRNRPQLNEDDLVQTSVGLIFRKLPAAIDGTSAQSRSTKPQLKVDDLKQSLFIRAKDWYGKYDDAVKKSVLTEDSVEVILKNGQVDASVFCIFCTPTDENRKIKIFCRSLDESKVNWTLSNLTKHEIRYHQLGEKQKKTVCVPTKGSTVPGDKNLKVNDDLKSFEAESIQPMEISNNDVQIDNVPNENVDDDIEMIGKDVSSEKSIENNPKPAENAGLDKKIEQYQDILYTAIYGQMCRMENCVMKHMDTTRVLIASNMPHKNSKSLVKVCDIEADGDCLFAALGHQLFYVSLKSEAHKKVTIDLRQQVVDHICENIDPFLHDLKDRLIENGVEDFMSDLPGCGHKFVKEELSQKGKWGGEETVKAVGSIYRANILILLDYETCILGNRFNPLYDRALVVNYRCYGYNNSKNKRNHYDSVCELSQESLESYVIKAMELEKQNILFQDAILNCKNFIIDV